MKDRASKNELEKIGDELADKCRSKYFKLINDEVADMLRTGEIEDKWNYPEQVEE